MERDQTNSTERFEIVRLLGEGACGKVYHVRDHSQNGKDLALKVLEKSPAFDNHTRDRFIKEILILCTIRHRNIVSAFEIINYDGKDAYTMELVNGNDLGAILEGPHYKKLSYNEIDSIMKQLLLAVEELHEQNIIHRDIKLDNIMLREDGIVKLNDLGLVKILHDNPKTDPGMILGTAHYISPEYILNQKIDNRADIYACGIILWELLSGTRRYEDNTEKVLRELVRSNFSHPTPKLPKDKKKYAYILKKALAVDVENRFQNAREMLEAFDGNFKFTFPTKKKLFLYSLYLVCFIMALIAIYKCV